MRRQSSCGTTRSKQIGTSHATSQDIIIQEKDSERCLIIDVAIPSDYNVQKKATEKMSKYVDIQIEWQRMWNKKVEVIPIIIGAT